MPNHLLSSSIACIHHYKAHKTKPQSSRAFHIPKHDSANHHPNLADVADGFNHSAPPTTSPNVTNNTPNTISTALTAAKTQLLSFDHQGTPPTKEQLLSVQSTLSQSLHLQTELMFVIKEDKLALQQGQLALQQDKAAFQAERDQFKVKIQWDEFKFELRENKVAMREEHLELQQQEHYQQQQQKQEYYQQQQQQQQDVSSWYNPVTVDFNKIIDDDNQPTAPSPLDQALLQRLVKQFEDAAKLQRHTHIVQRERAL